MSGFPKSLQKKMDSRAANHALRELVAPGSLIDFSSNDYLGFATNAQIANRALKMAKDHANGATGSRLITGNHPLYEDAESCIRSYHTAESALIFNSGYDANLGFFGCVPQRDDIVLYDELSHASIRDGIRLSAAKAYKFRHNDINHLKQLVEKHRQSATEIYIVTESVFSMDGDSPDLEAMATLASGSGARFIVDEAHAVGVFHRGLTADIPSVFATIITFGKALGCHGAAVLGSSPLRNYLINFSRSFIYTTGLPPHSLATVLAAYNHLASSPPEIGRLQNNIDFFKGKLSESNLSEHFLPSRSAIQVMLVPGTENVHRAAASLRQKRFDVRAITSPTVPPGLERLRICLHSFNTQEEITALVTLLGSFAA